MDVRPGLCSTASSTDAGFRMSVAGKVILITGAARGLGLEYAKLVSPRREHASLAATCWISISPDGVSVKLDVADMKSCEAMVAAAMENHGCVDGLVNNAALYGSLRRREVQPDRRGRLGRGHERQRQRHLELAARRRRVPAMRQTGGGSIVNIASLAATYGMPHALHYTTSKPPSSAPHLRGLARELGRDNIRVNAVAPSAVMTEGTREFLAGKIGSRARGDPRRSDDPAHARALGPRPEQSNGCSAMAALSSLGRR